MKVADSAGEGRIDEAERHLRRALELRPDEPAYRANLDFVRSMQAP